MGKLKISKAKKNKSSKGSSGIPNWLLSTLITIVVLAVLGTCVGTFLVSNGVFMRASTVMKLGDYKIDGNMMTYYYKEQISYYLNQQAQTYSSIAGSSEYLAMLGVSDPKDFTFDDYLSSFVGYNRYADPADQVYGDEKNEKREYKTWRDYFLAQATDTAKQIITYCAESDKYDNIKITDEDYTTIDETIEELLTSIRSQYEGLGGISDATCLANTYGQGVSIKDIRNAIELQILASKVQEKISNDVESSISKENIDKEYADNKINYNLVDYFTYSFNVNYDDIVSEMYPDKTLDKLTDDEKAKVLETYKKKIEEARASANELTTKNTLESFQEWVVDYTLKNNYDDNFNSAMSKVTDEQKPKKEGENDPLATIKDKMIEAVKKDLADGKTEITTDEFKHADDAHTIYGIAVSHEFEEAAKTLKKALLEDAITVKEDGTIKEESYVAPDEEGNKDAFSEWAFSSDRQVNNIFTAEEGDGANKAEVKVSDEYFSAEVYILTKTAYRSEESSYDIAYMLFTSEDKAKKAIEALGKVEGLNKEKFIEVAEAEDNHADAHTTMTDFESYFVGDLQVDEFDKWLTAAKVGEYTTTAIKVDDSSYLIGFYAKEGTLKAWEYDVKSALYEAKCQEYVDAMNAEFKDALNAGINEKLLAKIS